AERRLRGYRAAFEAASAQLPEAWVVAAPASVAGGEAGFDAAWARSPRPTAVLAMSDALAIGAIGAARELGLRVPEHLSVVGFDDIDLAAHVDPPLTTVHQPIRRKGEEAVRLLLAAIETTTPLVERVRLPTSLVVRRSSAPAARST
ncbi:MAG: substrate-binding domain-containing protein, partial [Chloroflexi bacterium]|nr:substrate-binding domain-containing protein [Chloroflexota bacterium]